MCSYNKINSVYACENPWTSNYLLKNELNFQGFSKPLTLPSKTDVRRGEAHILQ